MPVKWFRRNMVNQRDRTEWSATYNDFTWYMGSILVVHITIYPNIIDTEARILHMWCLIVQIANHSPCGIYIYYCNRPRGLFQDYNKESDNYSDYTYVCVFFFATLTFIHGMNEILLLLQISNSTFGYTMSGSGRVIKTSKTLYNARFSNAWKE